MPTSQSWQGSDDLPRDPEARARARATAALIAQASVVERELNTHVRQLWQFIDREELEK